MILAVANAKGGTAKSTTAVNVAACLAETGSRTLLIDLDAQGSASLSLGVDRADLSPSSADVLLDGAPLRQVIRSTTIDGLSLLTGARPLADADVVLAGKYGRELRLRRALEPVRDQFDFVLIDCPPSLSLLPVNALIAADAFIVPVVPQYLAMEGLVGMLDAVEQLRAAVGEVADLLGLVLTLVDYRTKVTGEIVAMIREHYGRAAFETEVRVNVRLAEAPSFGRSIFQHDRSSTGAEAYRNLTAEVRNRCREKGRHR